MVTLREINRENFGDVIDLSVFDGQPVPSNLYALAQAKVQPECIPLAIYNNDVLVGLIMYCIDINDNEYWIYRLMIDKNFQRMGYGEAAMKCLLSIIKQDKEHNKVYISFDPKNIGAKKLYEKLGFIPVGVISDMDEEVVYCLHYTN